MNALEQLLADVLLNDPYRNVPNPDRTIETIVIGQERISTITRPDGSQFQVVASVPTPKKAGGTARIIYPEEVA